MPKTAPPDDPALFASLPEAADWPAALTERVRVVAAGPPDGGFVLYWMHNALRAHENPALDAAVRVGHATGLPVLVYQGLSERYPFASDRHHTFVLEGARDVHRELAGRGVASILHVERPGHRGPHLKTLARAAALVVTEDIPTAPSKGWTETLAAEAGTPLWAVDTACVVPTRLTKKAYDRAFAYRNSTKRFYEERLSAVWEDVSAGPAAILPEELPFEPVPIAEFSDADIADLVGACEIDHAVGPVPHTRGGSVAGYDRWDDFRDHRLKRYARVRNNAADLHGVSRLSAYLHYGMVSPLRVAREAVEADTPGSEKYLDELLIWRELAYHFCAHTKADIDTLEAIPEWARESLAESARRKTDRPKKAKSLFDGEDVTPVYDWETLARGKTDDTLWDLTQASLLRQGELHNNVRMTWGKAIAAWADGPERGLELLLDLNHRFALDGRDPGSYGGLLWCLGQFDRPFDPPSGPLGRVRGRSTGQHAGRIDLNRYRDVVTRPPVESPPRVAVVGGGISGLAAARTLADHGLDVTVFDKGRRPGGRCSTREVDGVGSFDHGAQYFTARDPRFRQYVEAWVERGVVAEWNGRIVAIGRDGVTDKPGTTRYVGVPGMQSVAAHLAADVDVRRGVRVESLEREGDRWRVSAASEDGSIEAGPFDVVIVTAPPAQVGPLVGAHSASLAEAAAAVELTPCFAAMAAFDGPLGLDFEGAFVNGIPGEADESGLSWVADMSSRPGRPTGSACWVLHATADWTRAHLDDDRDAAAGSLLAEFGRVAGKPLPTPSLLKGHRWLYAFCDTPRADGCVAEDGLIVAGDWCHGARIEGAFLSGVDAAGRVLRGLSCATAPAAVGAIGG
ncbi:MAG: FAD-dependent oxidoreductase [Planctomycetota bacterium]